jgi:hypothetical protein
MFGTKFIEKIRADILYLIFFSVQKSRVVYEIMKKNNVEPDRPHMTIQHDACVLLTG